MTGGPVTGLDDRPAGLGRRFVAVLVDQLIVLVLGGGVVLAAVLRTATSLREGATPGSAPPAPLLLLCAVLAGAVTVAQWLAHGRFGWTVGRRLLGIRTVDVHSRRPIGPGRVLVRGLVVAAGALACAVGQVVVLLSPLLDRTGRHRGWHDRAVDAEVLRVAAGPRVGDPGPLGRGHGGGADGGRPGPGTRTDASAPEPPTTPAHRAPASPSAAPADRAPAHPTPAHPARATAAPATPAGGLVLAPLHPQRAAPDLDTRAIPVVRATAPTLAFGLAPELEMTRPAPPRADVVPEPRAGTAAGLRVALDDGRVLTVTRLALVGRNPSPGPDLQVVRVVDPARSVSKTHLQLAVDTSGGAWVVDRGSTNGTLVTLPDGAQVVCPVDHPVRLREGAVVVFGDRSLRVVAMPATSGGAGRPPGA